MYNPAMEVVITDIETGGLELHHPIIQIAAIAIVPNTQEIKAEFNVKVAFVEADCDPEALAINHYKAEDWVGAVSIEEALRQLKTFYSRFANTRRKSGKGGAYYVAIAGGYNSRFDSDRLFAAAKRLGIFLPVDPRFLDVMQLAMWNLTLEGYKLTDIAAHFGIVTDGAHDALVDVKLTAAVMYKLRGTR